MAATVTSTDGDRVRATAIESGHGQPIEQIPFHIGGWIDAVGYPVTYEVAAGTGHEPRAVRSGGAGRAPVNCPAAQAVAADRKELTVKDTGRAAAGQEDFRAWPDSEGTPLREGDHVRYHGPEPAWRGTWTFGGPCQCETCCDEFFGMCEASHVRRMRFIDERTGQIMSELVPHIPNRHVLRREDGTSLEHVREAHITAVAGGKGQPGPAMATADVLRAKAPCSGGESEPQERRLWVLGFDDGLAEPFGNQPVRVYRDHRGPVLDLIVDGRPVRHRDPRLQPGCGIELWNWEEPADCCIAVFDDEAAMLAGVRALDALRTTATRPSARRPK